MKIQSLEDIKNLPPRAKILAVGIIYLLVAYFFWFFLLQSAWEERSRLQTSVYELKTKVDSQERVVARKDKYLREVALLNERFHLALLKLPEREEIPSLLNAVAQEGKRAGLDFVLFEPIVPPPPPKDPKAGVKKEQGKGPDGAADQFYETIQINMTVSGRFNDIAAFYDRLARLPRIVNADQLTLGDRSPDEKRPGVLMASVVMKTYMFVPRTEEDKRGATGGKGK